MTKFIAPKKAAPLSNTVKSARWAQKAKTDGAERANVWLPPEAVRARDHIMLAKGLDKTGAHVEALIAHANRIRVRP